MKELMEFEMPKIKFIKADSEDIIQTSGLIYDPNNGVISEDNREGDALIF